MVTNQRPWTFVLSEYLDLPFLLRASGEDVVSARSAREALECLDHWCPTRIIIDSGCEGAEQVLAYAQRFCSSARVEMQEQVITSLLAS